MLTIANFLYRGFCTLQVFQKFQNTFPTKKTTRFVLSALNYSYIHTLYGPTRQHPYTWNVPQIIYLSMKNDFSYDYCIFCKKMLHNQQFSALQESHLLPNLALIFSKITHRTTMKISCAANNPNDALCTISAHDLTPKLITFLS